MKTVLAIVVTVTALTVTAVVFGAVSANGDQNNKTDWSTMLGWEPCVWWVTETHVLRDISKTDSGAPSYGESIFQHKWTAAKSEPRNGEECWRVEIRSHAVPATIVNDQGDEPLFVIWISKSTFTLRSIEASVRSGEYQITGKEPLRYSEKYEKEQPVVVNWIATSVPLDIPLLPTFWNHRRDANISSKYVDSRTKKNIAQKITSCALIKENQRVDGLVVGISGDGLGIRTMKWEEGCPWWREWQCLQEDGSVSGLWYSKTIDWKGKKDAKEASDTPTTKAK